MFDIILILWINLQNRTTPVTSQFAPMGDTRKPAASRLAEHFGQAISVGNPGEAVGKSGNLHFIPTCKLLKTRYGSPSALIKFDCLSLQTGGFLKCRRMIGFFG